MIAAAVRKGKPIVWHLQFYVAGDSPRSIRACANLKEVCEEHISGRYQIQVIDVLAHPDAARVNQIMVLPTLVRIAIGDLADTGGISARLNLLPQN